MQMFNKVIRDCRRAKFKAAKTLGDLTGQQTIKGSLWLLLSNRTTLKETDQEGRNQLLAQNQPLATLYALKEQLQRLWHPGSAVADMARVSTTGAAWRVPQRSPAWQSSRRPCSPTAPASGHMPIIR
jgi:hypothetical protein